MSAKTARYYHASDQKELLKLYATEISSFYVSKRLEAFNWITRSNPRAKNISPGFIIDQGGKTIGYWCRMPIHLFIHGQKYIAFFSHECLVDASMRGQGFAKMLLEKLEKETPFLLLSLWHNRSTYFLHVNRDWKPLYYRPSLKIIRLKQMLRDWVKRNPVTLVPLIAISLWGWVVEMKRPLAPEKNLQISEIDNFDERFDWFFEQILHKLPVITERSSEILRWKYSLIPYIQYQKLKVERNGNICGYSILRKERNKGIIVDFLVDPDDIPAFHLLLSHSIKFFRNQKVSFVECLFTHSRFRNLARRHGFFPGKRKRENSLLVKDRSGILNAHLLNSLDNWHITFGDSDRDMWVGTRG